MIYLCENCINRVNCPENQKQYKALCKKIKKQLRKKKYNCFYSLQLKCDYWIAGKDESVLLCRPTQEVTEE